MYLHKMGSLEPEFPLCKFYDNTVVTFVFRELNGYGRRQIGCGSFAFLTVGKFALAVFENSRNQLWLLQK